MLVAHPMQEEWKVPMAPLPTLSLPAVEIPEVMDVPQVLEIDPVQGQVEIPIAPMPTRSLADLETPAVRITEEGNAAENHGMRRGLTHDSSRFSVCLSALVHLFCSGPGTWNRTKYQCVARLLYCEVLHHIFFL